uniref:BTB domain-containing protein n=1 Tax=Anopheles epiroticus TaxID=199890 RepID=A0A182PHS8_9DIPT
MAKNNSSSFDEIEQTALLATQLAQLCTNADYADVTFIVENNRIPAHRVILATRSEYFRALLYGGLKESKQSEIRLDVPVKAFEHLIKYIYTGSMSLKQMSDSEIIETLGLAHQYGFIDLQKAIVGRLSKVISIENVCLLFNIAQLFHLDHLLSASGAFMDENATRIVSLESFRGLSYDALLTLLDRDTFDAPEVDIFKAVHGWCCFNQADQPKCKALYGKVRFTLIPQKDLFAVVRSANVLDSDRLLDIIDEKAKIKNPTYRGLVSD